MGIRVTGGVLRGRALGSPKGAAVRPTAARVREALFSILGQRLDGWSVLDLFAGAGTLGVEAGSRGASPVVFVERDRRTAALLQRNVALLDGWSEAEVLVCDVRRALGLLARRGQAFDLVLLDPPYRRGAAAACLQELAGSAATLIAQDGRIVAETEVDDELPASLPGLVLLQRRVYGQTALMFYAREPR